MRRRRSLRFRVAAAFAALGALLSFLFAGGIWLAAHDVSRRLMDETLEAELADYMSRHARNPVSLPPSTAGLRGYLLPMAANDTPLPAELKPLMPGRHDVLLNGTPYRVAIAERAGIRYVLLFDASHQQRREQRFLLYLGVGVLLMTLVSSLGGLWLAGLVIAPVTDLAAAVGAAAPDSPPRFAHLIRPSRHGHNSRNGRHTPFSQAGDPGAPGDEIDELARTFDRYFDRLAAFVERERAFATDASHELRTPLAAIRGAAELLAEDPSLSPVQATRVARITRTAEDMGELIAAILLLARESDEPIDAPCDANRIAGNCIERYRSLATARNNRIDLDLAGEVHLAVPAAYFAIVLANLVHNAIAHTRDGSIVVTLDDKRLVVRDTGSGIPPADLAHVFERHYRGADSSGAGIGLSLVKRICERLNWQISVANRASGGTAITIDFAR
jgi:signal transduction histidine kinase